MDKIRGRRLLAVAIAWLAVAPVVPVRAATTTVIERGTEFSPKQVDVKVGDTVVWVYESGPGGSSHTVTFDNGPDLNPNCNGFLLDTGCQNRTNPTVQRTFNVKGTFPYRCKIHGDNGMVGVVVVSPAGTTSSIEETSTTSTTRPRATTTSSTAKASTSSTTTTTRELATSSTLVRSTTTTADSTSVLLPGDAPAFPGDDASAAGSSSDSGSDTGTVVLIVVLLLVVAGGGGFLLWKLRPGRA